MSNIERLARQVAGSQSDALSQCRKLVGWMQAELEWSVTDYQTRTVDNILARRAGNCAEQSRVLTALLTVIGIPSRPIAEINLQLPWVERGQFAEKMVAERGPSASVFGTMHNDHRWLEVRDLATGIWHPADASLGICGDSEWVAARIAFGERPAAARDMIVPIMVLVMGSSNQAQDDRTEHYLVDAFQAYLGECGRESRAFADWCRLVRVLAAGGKRAFAGVQSFLEYAEPMQQALDAYRQIQRDCSKTRP